MSDKKITLVPINPDSGLAEIKVTQAHADSILARENGGGWKLKDQNESRKGKENTRGKTSTEEVSESD